MRGQGQAPRERVAAGEGPCACPERQAGWRAVAQAGRASVKVSFCRQQPAHPVRCRQAAGCCRTGSPQPPGRSLQTQAALTCCMLLQAGSEHAWARAAGVAGRQPAAGWRTHGVKSPALCGRAVENAAACRCTSERREGATGRLSQCLRAQTLPACPAACVPPVAQPRMQQEKGRKLAGSPEPYGPLHLLYSHRWLGRGACRHAVQAHEQRSTAWHSAPLPPAGGGHTIE